MTNIVLLGPPGSGKGTQAEKISEEFGLPQVSTGNILRHEIETSTPLGIKAKSYMGGGELVPDELVDEMVRKRIKKDDCRGGFILDGFPRDLEQAKILELIVPIDFVFDIQVPDDALIERLSARRVCDCGETYHLKNKPPKKHGVCDKCGNKIYQRKDDDEATIRHRLQVYHEQTEPLIRFYDGKKVLCRIDGLMPIAHIYGQIKAHLQ